MKHFVLVAWAGLIVGALTLRAQEAVTKTTWNGFERLDFMVAERPCLLVRPKLAASGRPWIWRTEFFGTEPQVDLALLAHGWHVAYMDTKNMYGGPRAMALFEAFYTHAVEQHALARRVVLEGFSRGGLYACNFAQAHPGRAAALYLDAPVLDIRSWPGRHKATEVGLRLWEECLASYGLTEETVDQWQGPLDRLASLAAARVPIMVVSGDADQSVRFEENSAVLVKRYRELGGTVELMLKPGGGHHPHSLPDPAPIVCFLIEHARFR